jgi:hypothetical protein
MAATFTQILWGALIVFVDIRVGWFDMALDAIGYAMIVTALPRLIPASAAFGTARMFAIVAGVVSLPASLPIQPIRPINPIQLFGALQTLLDAFMIWYLCSGVIEMAQARMKVALALDADKVRTLNVVAYAMALFVMWMTAMAGESLVLVIPAVLFGLTSGILTLLLLKRASVEIAGG